MVRHESISGGTEATNVNQPVLGNLSIARGEQVIDEPQDMVPLLGPTLPRPRCVSIARIWVWRDPVQIDDEPNVHQHV